MTIRPLVLASLLLAAACAHREPPLPGCDGSARRPANPHGSVLDVPTPPPAVPAPLAPVSPSASAGGCA